MKIGDKVKVSWIHLIGNIGTVVSIRTSDSCEVEFDFNITTRNYGVRTYYDNQRSFPSMYKFKGKPEHSLFFNTKYLDNTLEISGTVSSIITSKIFKLDEDKICVLDCPYVDNIKIGDNITINYTLQNKLYKVYSITVNQRTSNGL